MSYTCHKLLRAAMMLALCGILPACSKAAPPATPHHSSAAAKSVSSSGAVWKELKFDCSPPDPRLDAAQQERIFPKEDGTPGYCVATIDMTSLPAYGLKRFYVLRGNTLGNCAGPGCYTSFYQETNTGKISDVTPDPNHAPIQVPEGDIMRYKIDTSFGAMISAGYMIIGCPWKEDGCPRVIDPKTGKSQAAGGGQDIYTYSAKAHQFVQH